MKRSLAVLVFAITWAIAPARANLVTLDQQPAGGSFFDLLVDVTGVFDGAHSGDSLLAYGFDLSFDHNVVSYLGEEPGLLFTDLSNNPGIGAQVAGFATSILLNPGDFTEPLNLAILHFNLIGSAPATIGIAGDPLLNSDQGLIYLSVADPIAAQVVIPEPTGLGALAAGVLVIAAVVRSARSHVPR